MAKKEFPYMRHNADIPSLKDVGKCLIILAQLGQIYSRFPIPTFQTSGIKPPRDHFQTLGQDHFIGCEGDDDDFWENRLCL